MTATTARMMATTARIRAASAAKPGTTVRPPPAVAVGMAMVAAVGRATIRPATVAGNPAAGKAAGGNLPERNPAQGPDQATPGRRLGAKQPRAVGRCRVG